MPSFYLLAVIPSGEVGAQLPKLNVFCSVTKRNGWADTRGLRGEEGTELRANPILDAGLIHGTLLDAYRGMATHWLELKF